MSRVWMGISPGPMQTRILVLDSVGRAILKARLARAPANPRALPILCEAIALWCGQSVFAAVDAAHPVTSSDTRSWLSTCGNSNGEPLYEIRVVRRARAPNHRARIVGLGSFRDMRQLLLFPDTEE